MYNIRNLRTYPEETKDVLSFAADIFEDGQKVTHVYNEGKEFQLVYSSTNWELFNKLIEYALQNSKVVRDTPDILRRDYFVMGLVRETIINPEYQFDRPLLPAPKERVTIIRPPTEVEVMFVL